MTVGLRLRCWASLEAPSDMVRAAVRSGYRLNVEGDDPTTAKWQRGRSEGPFKARARWDYRPESNLVPADRESRGTTRT